MKDKEHEPHEFISPDISRTDESRVLLAITITQNAVLSLNKWVEWLQSRTPKEIVDLDVKVESVFQSDSTLVLVSIPIRSWDRLRNNDAYQFVGFVKSKNVLELERFGHIKEVLNSVGTKLAAFRLSADLAHPIHADVERADSKRGLTPAATIWSSRALQSSHILHSIDEAIGPFPERASVISNRDSGYLSLWNPSSARSSLRDSNSKTSDVAVSRGIRPSADEPLTASYKYLPQFFTTTDGNLVSESLYSFTHPDDSRFWSLIVDSHKDKGFLEERGAIKQWFQVLSDGEGGSTLLTLLGQCHPSRLWFFKAIIEAYMESIPTRHSAQHRTD